MNTANTRSITLYNVEKLTIKLMIVYGGLLCTLGHMPTYTQKKSSWTLIKVQFSNCFILGKLKAYYVKQVNVLFTLIPNLKESVDK